MGGQILNAAWTAGITIVVLFIGLVGAGFWLLARRTKNGRTPNALASLARRANILLVRVDDAVKNAEDELGFAIAQFGDVKSQEFDVVLVTAKAQLREAFALQQKLDDAFADTETQRRDWNGRIIHLCESAQSSLDAQEESFARLRELEKNAPQNLAAVRTAIDALKAKEKDAASTLTSLSSRYVASAISTVADNLDRAKSEHKLADKAADQASEALAGSRATSATPSDSASDFIRTASEHTYRAQKLLDAIDTLRDELATAANAVEALRESTSVALSEARAVRDAPPDPEAGHAVGLAIVTAEKAMGGGKTTSGKKKVSDPLATLELLRSANADLDASLAGARNQKQRLEGARTALVGALVSAKSQITATRNYIDTRRNSVGSEARTRLAEAERLLVVAQAEADPVAALDSARSSATYSRDADALARFDLSGA